MSSGPRVAPGALVCQGAETVGDVTIGAGTVCHPRCRILATDGPIVIGKDNIVEENATIRNRSSKPLVIGDGNTFEVGSLVEASRVGSVNRFEPLSIAEPGAVVEDRCVVGAACRLQSSRQLAANSVLYGNGLVRTRIDVTENEKTSHARHLEYLRDVLPKYNHMRSS